MHVNYPFGTNICIEEYRSFFLWRDLTYNDALAIGESPDIDAVKRIVPETGSNMQLIAEDNNTNARVVGTTPEFAEAPNKIIASGEFISQYDVDNRTMVCVLGSQLANKLFDEGDPLDRRVRVKGRSFTVLGVFESDGGAVFATSRICELVVGST